MITTQSIALVICLVLLYGFCLLCVFMTKNAEKEPAGAKIILATVLFGLVILLFRMTIIQ